MIIGKKQNQRLKQNAHHLKPTVKMGKEGLHTQLIEEVNRNLKAHELIKVDCGKQDKILKNQNITSICEQTGAQLINQCGNIATLYKKRTKQQKHETSVSAY